MPGLAVAAQLGPKHGSCCAVRAGPVECARVRKVHTRMTEQVIAGVAQRTILEDHRIVGTASSEPPGTA